ncbi:MAG: family 16 glycosylhydrolase [Rikenellaceae bacterium]
MNKRNILIVLSSLYLATSCQEANNPYQHQGWELVWSDEFNNDGAVDASKWSFESGFSRNQEAQWYQEENAVCRDGKLIIEARQETVQNPNFDAQSKSWKENREEAEYTSALIKTKEKFDFLYGRVEVRAKIPTSGGVWPAIWMLGSNQVWPSCGEVDIMEYYRIGGKPHILANVAWGNDKPYVAKWDSEKIPFTYFTGKDPEWIDKFHVWRMDWDAENIKIYLDDELLNETPISKTVNGVIGEYSNPFKSPQYILLNLALGSRCGGEIDQSALPTRFEIDYVRVYQKEQKPHASFKPAAIWTDTDGVHINAHGGGMLYHKGRYYWFGEHKVEHTSDALVGVRVYSSKDLYNWQNEGVALSVAEDGSGHDIEKGCIIERPKVIYNPATEKFVMWFHLELKGQGYKAARYGVAVSDTPAGPYEFLYSSRSCAGVWPANMTEEQIETAKSITVLDRKNNWRETVEAGGVLSRDFEGGQMSRDMTLFVDDDGAAYHIFSSEDNQTLHIAQLTDDFLHHSDNYVRVLAGDSNEAPAIFKRNGVYWMISSGCTGWAPNAARLSRADSIMGEWTTVGNPCVGEGANKTFHSQSTYILPVEGKEDLWIFMADRWMPDNPIDGRYLFLPIEFKDDAPMLQFTQEWSIK